MTLRSNRCEGTDEATVTTSNTDGPDQFTAVNSTPVFDTAQFYQGASSIRINTDGAGGAKYVRWTDGANQTHATARLLVRMSGSPPSNTSFCQIQNSTGTGNFRMQIITTRAIRAQNSAGTTLATTTAIIPLDTWIRLELECDTGTGDWSIKYYEDPASNTVTETISGTGASLGSDVRRIQDGLTVRFLTGLILGSMT